MKQVVISMLFLCMAYTTGIAQQTVIISPVININGVVKSYVEDLQPGTPFVLQQFVTVKRLPPHDRKYRQAALLVNGVQKGISIYDLPSIELKPTDPNTFWLAEQINSELISYYQKKGLQESLRKEMENEANEYINNLEKAQLIYEDAALEDYIQCIMLSILPHQMLSDRYGIPYVRLLKSPSPDILMLGNNCLLVSTGLLTTLDTKEELFSILAREIAHYVLDHAVITVNKNITRVNRSVFWGEIASIAAAATEVYLYDRYDNYNPGTIFSTNAIIQTLVNENIYRRMGLDYSKKQEQEADNAAIRLLKLMKKDPASLTSALGKIQKFYRETQDGEIFEKYNIHESLNDRIAGLQKEYPVSESEKDLDYLMHTSALVSFSAAMTEYNRNYALAMKLAQKNIENRMFSPNDYLIMAQCIMKQNNTKESNQYCETLLEKAASYYQEPDLNITKQKILLFIRSDKRQKAIEELNIYKQLLNRQYNLPHNDEDDKWITQELNWITRLIQQLSFHTGK